MALRFTELTPVRNKILFQPGSKIWFRKSAQRDFKLLQQNFAAGRHPVNPDTTVCYGCGKDPKLPKKLAESAQHVISIDCNVRKLGRNEGANSDPYIIYRRAREGTIPLKRNSVNFFVSLGTLEHIVDHRAFMEQVVRILRPTGRLIVSTSNHDVYPKSSDRHVHELGFEEFNRLVRRHFASVELFGQGDVRGFSKSLSDARKWAANLGMLKLARKLIPLERYYRLLPKFLGNSNVVPIEQIKGEPLFMIAICKEPAKPFVSIPTEVYEHFHGKPLIRL